jgi:hypothetical protein
MPFIVGASRSGTTLLRLMLDSHPDLAIPPETHFLPQINSCGPKVETADSLIGKLVTSQYWSDYGLTWELLARQLSSIRPFSATHAIREFYRLYAERYGKIRWGDKTPPYVCHMVSIQSLLPEAYFIHLIRDGRDVAASMRSMWWGPGQEIGAQASRWRNRILDARRQAPQLHHYMEIHFEHLVKDPEHVLRVICDFIEIPFRHEMLEYHLHAEHRLRELQNYWDPRLRETITRDRRHDIFALTRNRPDASRAGAWIKSMTDKEVFEFEEIAGDILMELGYKLSSQK